MAYVYVFQEDYHGEISNQVGGDTDFLDQLLEDNRDVDFVEEFQYDKEDVKKCFGTNGWTNSTSERNKSKGNEKTNAKRNALKSAIRNLSHNDFEIKVREFIEGHTECEEMNMRRQLQQLVIIPEDKSSEDTMETTQQNFFLTCSREELIAVCEFAVEVLRNRGALYVFKKTQDGTLTKYGQQIADAYRWTSVEKGKKKDAYAPWLLREHPLVRYFLYLHQDQVDVFDYINDCIDNMKNAKLDRSDITLLYTEWMKEIVEMYPDECYEWKYRLESAMFDEDVNMEYSP